MSLGHGGYRDNSGRRRIADFEDFGMLCERIAARSFESALRQKLQATRSSGEEAWLNFVAKLREDIRRTGDAKVLGGNIVEISRLVQSGQYEASHDYIRALHLPDQYSKPLEKLEYFTQYRSAKRTPPTISVRGVRTRICKRVAHLYSRISGQKISWQTVSRYWRQYEMFCVET